METKPRATRTRRTTASPKGPVAATTPTRRTTRASAGPSPTHEQIAERAHEIYVQSGYQQGREQEFWFEAERQLKEPRKPMRL